MSKSEEARLNAALAIVGEQAGDRLLWKPETAAEAVLIAALRRLHEAIEGKTSAECAREILKATP